MNTCKNARMDESWRDELMNWFPSCIVEIIIEYGREPEQMWVVVDTGCIECSEVTSVVSVCKTQKRALEIFIEHYQYHKKLKQTREDLAESCDVASLEALEPEHCEEYSFDYFSFGQRRVEIFATLVDVAG
jgi:hypothetical protein